MHIKRQTLYIKNLSLFLPFSLLHTFASLNHSLVNVNLSEWFWWYQFVTQNGVWNVPGFSNCLLGDYHPPPPPPPVFLLCSPSIVWMWVVLECEPGSCCCWSLLYSAILCSQADSLRLHVILHEWVAFYSAFLTVHQSGVLTALAWLVPHEIAAILAHSVYTIQPCTMSLHAKPHK